MLQRLSTSQSPHVEITNTPCKICPSTETAPVGSMRLPGKPYTRASINLPGDTNPEDHCRPASVNQNAFQEALPESGARLPPVPYSVFTKGQKRYITYLLGFLTLASSLTATIYFPLIPLLAEEYQTSTQAINLTITLYVVFQGITPSFWGPLSDSFGRRPVLMITFVLYTAASLGLAFSRGSYPALILLRALQSTGGSAIVSLSYGVVADLVTSAERGSLLGPLLASGNIGPCIGPIIGGAVVTASQPAWCFWTLVIFGYVVKLMQRIPAASGTSPTRRPAQSALTSD